jgi:CMP-N-acetylneuraminic acid synthetase
MTKANMKVVAVVPARSGSKRSPGKNVALFRGKPLVSHTIEQAMEAQIFDEIVVTTNCEEIMEMASQYPVAIQDREANLSDDNATVLDVIRETGIRALWNSRTTVSLLQVTAPLRSIEDIRKAHDIYCEFKGERGVVSVAEMDYPMQLVLKIEDQALIPLFPDVYRQGLRKQDQSSTYRWNDAVIFDSFANFMDDDRPNLLGSNPVPFVMPLERSVAIDYPFQLRVCQVLGDTLDIAQ